MFFLISEIRATSIYCEIFFLTCNIQAAYYVKLILFTSAAEPYIYESKRRMYTKLGVVISVILILPYSICS